jgi:DNA-binding MarR family transcriptional regulator
LRVRAWHGIRNSIIKYFDYLIFRLWKKNPMSTPRMNRYVALVRDFAARVVLFHDMVAQRLGLHASEVKALRLLGEGAMTAGQLAELTGLTAASVTALVDRLEAMGFVKRERDAGDRRRVTVRAVSGKIRDLDRLYEAYHAEMAKVLSQYSADEFAAIADYLARASALLVQETAKLRAQR